MTAKAKNLTQVYNYFRPTPLSADKREFYQPTAMVRSGMNKEMYQLLFSRIKQAEGNLHSLVVGHGGCGKSTELRMLAAELEKVGGASILIEARDDFDLNSFTYIDIFVRIVEKAILYAKNNGIKISKKLLETFQAALCTKSSEKYWEAAVGAKIEAGASVDVTLPPFLKFIATLTASFKMGSGIKEELRREIKPNMTVITNAFNAVVDEINKGKENHQKMLVVIDGLEKCRSDNVRELFRDDIATIAGVNTHLAISCPISVFRSSDAAVFTGYFDKPDIMPMIKTHERGSIDEINEAGIETIKKLIYRRVEETLFDEGVLERIIEMGGGNLRDTFYLIENSAFTATQFDRETVDMASADRMITEYASDIFLRFSTSKYGPYIKQIYDGKRGVLNEEQLFELLYAGAVFEYNGKRWVDLHPLVRKHLDDNPDLLQIIERAGAAK